jgi:WD40 repeat protein
LRVHDARSGRLTATLRGHAAAISTIALAPDGDFIATGGRDCTIRIFDLNRREEVQILAGHKKTVAAISYFPDGRGLASVALDSSLLLWSPDAGSPRATLWAGSGEIFSGVRVTGDEPWIVASLAGGGLRLWAPE